MGFERSLSSKFENFVLLPAYISFEFVLDAVHCAEWNVDRLVLSHCLDVVVDRDLGGALNDNPVLAAVIVPEKFSAHKHETLEIKKGPKAKVEAFHSEQLIILKTNTLTNL
jgi:hypothetical protein